MGIVLSLLSKVPIWVWAVIGLATWGYFGHQKAQRYEQARLESIAETERIARSVEAKKDEKRQKVEQNYAKNEQALKRNLDSMHTSYLSLQQLIATDNHTTEDIATVCGTYVERNRVVERLLKESNDLVSEGAERVGKLGTKISALQEYISSVCVSE